MANKFKKFFAMVLALCMLVIISPLQALAEKSVYPDDINADLNVDQANGTIDIVFTPVDGTEEEGGDLEWETELNLGDNVETELKDLTVTEEETEEGGTIVIESATVGTEGTLDNGATVEGEETHVETTITDADGTITETDVTDGHEKMEWTGEGIENIEGLENLEGIEDLEGLEDLELPPVEVELKPGDTATNTVTGTVEGTIGDEKEGEDDLNYDYTDVTIEVDRTVTTETSKLEVSDAVVNREYDSLVDPTLDTDKTWNTSGTPDDPQRNGLYTPSLELVTVQGAQQQKDPDDGYDFFLSGLGESTEAAAPVFMYIVYARYTAEDEAAGKIPEGYKVGDLIPDPNGYKGYKIDENKSGLIDGSNNKVKESGMDYSPSQLVLTNTVYQRYTAEDEAAGLIPAGAKVGDIKYDENNKPLIDEEASEYFYAYCADYLVETDQVPGHRYMMENLEDSGHYTEEDAQKLRAIVMNGYWGDPETGSLDQIKANLTEYAANNPKIIVQDKNGNDVEFDLATLLGEMTESEALAVTQAAIWAYSINRTGTADDKLKQKYNADDITVIGAYSALKYYYKTQQAKDEEGNLLFNENGVPIAKPGTTSWLSEYYHAIDQDNLDKLNNGYSYADVSDEERARREVEALRSDARMAAMFAYLMSLEGIPDTDESVTTIINEKNFIEEDSLSLVVHDRVEDHVDNQDDNHDNDVYNTDLKFSLAFVPGENDDLLIYVYGVGDEPIVRRIAGENSEGREAEDILYDAENDVYILTGLQLGENEETKFDLRLDGIQNLKNGVYLYTAEGGRLASQTLVGMAGGSQHIDITASMTISFSVDENNHVVAERYWHNESDPVTEPDNPPYNPPVPYEIPPRTEEPRPQVRYRLARNVGQLETIIDEEVPLAEVPQTGDISVVWFAMVLVAGMGLCMLKLSEKKCRA